MKTINLRSIPLLLLLLTGLSLNVHASLAQGTNNAAEPTKVLELLDSDEKLLLTGEWLVEFYAEWCGVCQHFGPQYRAVAEQMFDEMPQIRMAMVNIEKQGGLASRFQVSRLPTIYHVKDGKIRVPDLPAMSGQAITEYIRNFHSKSTPPLDVWEGAFSPYSFYGEFLFWFGWCGGQITGVARMLPWWSYWAIVAGLMGLTVYAVYQEEEPGHPVEIVDKRPVEDDVEEKETAPVKNSEKAGAKSRKARKQ